MENAECGVRSAECGKCGVWIMRSVENKSLNNDILNNDKFIDQTYTLIRHIQRIGLNDDGFLLGYDIETKFSRIFTNHIHSTSYRKSSIKPPLSNKPPPSLISHPLSIKPPLPLPQFLFFTKKLTINVD